MNKQIAFLTFLGLVLAGCVNYPNPQVSNATSNPVSTQEIIMLPIIQNKTTAMSHIFVKSVDVNSPGHKSGLFVNDEILSINGLRFATAEKFYEHLRKARWIRNDFEIIREENGRKSHVKLTINPEQNHPEHGLRFKFAGQNNEPVYPIFLNHAFIHQFKEQYGFGASIVQSGMVLKISVSVRNLSDEDFIFSQESITLLDKDKIVLPFINDRGSSNKVKIPAGAKIIKDYYADKTYVNFPLTLSAKLDDEEFEFKFNIM